MTATLRCRWAGMLLGLLISSGTVLAQDPDPGPLYREALARHGVGTDLESLLSYLSQLHPEHPRQRQVAELIQQLGADEFRTRREAMFALSDAPELTQVQLARAEHHQDQEVRKRAATLRKKQQAEGDFVLFSALRCLRLHADPRTVPVLLTLIPDLADETLCAEARSALLASVADVNTQELLAAADSGLQPVRTIALTALGRIRAPRIDPILESHLRSANDDLALAAAEALAWTVPEAALPTLWRLLSSPDFDIRRRAASILQTTTGQQFGFAPYAEDACRREAILRWQAWIRDEGRTASLTPLCDHPARSGRILLCLFRPFTVAELDQTGRVVFRSSATRAACGGETSCANGHRYFADWERKTILELDPYGQTVGELALPGIPNSLHLLGNGNIVTGIYNHSLVCEVDPAGNVVWDVSVDGQPSDARRLPNGNTLVALNNRHRIVEVDAGKQIVWQLDGDEIDALRSPESARRLDNGNTLVACGRDGKVREFAPDGRVVWEAGDLKMAYDAVLLDNGHILVGYQSGLRELDRSRNVIRDLDQIGVVRRIYQY